MQYNCLSANLKRQKLFDTNDENSFSEAVLLLFVTHVFILLSYLLNISERAAIGYCSISVNIGKYNSGGGGEERYLIRYLRTFHAD